MFFLTPGETGLWKTYQTLLVYASKSHTFGFSNVILESLMHSEIAKDLGITIITLCQFLLWHDPEKTTFPPVTIPAAWWEETSSSALCTRCFKSSSDHTAPTHHLPIPVLPSLANQMIFSKANHTQHRKTAARLEQERVCAPKPVWAKQPFPSFTLDTTKVTFFSWAYFWSSPLSHT